MIPLRLSHMTDPINKEKLCTHYPREALTLNLTEEANKFQHWTIASLPQEVWGSIIGYLSLQDVNNLGIAYAGTSQSLNACGVSEVQYYCSLPENQKHFFKKLSISNQQLIKYIKSAPGNPVRDNTLPSTNETPIAAHNHESNKFTDKPNLFLIKKFPEAIFSCFANYVFNHLSRTNNLTLTKCFEIHDNTNPRHLNNNFNRILEILEEDKINIWIANSNGTWEMETTIDGCHHVNKYESQHDANLLLVPRSKLGKEMHIWERNFQGAWVMTQHMRFEDIGFADTVAPTNWLLEMSAKNIKDIFFSHDARSALCRSFSSSVVLGRDPDGKWSFKGTTPLGHEVYYSEDSKHIAILCDDVIYFMSNQNDRWEKSGVLTFELCVEKEHVQFSPDNKHLVAWFDDAGDDEYYVFLTRDDFHVKIASYDGQRWSEQQNIIEKTASPCDTLRLIAQFSRDGQHLLVCNSDEVKVWTLSSDNTWSKTNQYDRFFQIKNESFDNDPTVCFTMNPRKIMLVIYGYCGVFDLAENGLLTSSITIDCCDEFQPVISPDGNSFICQRSYHGEIWQRHEGRGWEKQITDQLFEVAKFNHGGYLLALKNNNTLILLGLTDSSTWHKKTHLTAEDTIEDFSFSPCDRFIVILTKRKGERSKTLWQISFNDDVQREMMLTGDNATMPLDPARLSAEKIQ